MIYWYLDYMSRKERASQPAVESTTWPIRGRGNGSFGWAFVEASVVDAHPPFFVLLDQD